MFRLHLTPFIASQLSSGIQSGENIYIYSTTTSPSPCLANIRTFSYSFFKLQMTCHPHFSRGLVWSAWRSSAPWSTGSLTAGSRSMRPRRISMFLKLKTSCFHLLTYIHKTQCKAKFIQDDYVNCLYFDQMSKMSFYTWLHCVPKLCYLSLCNFLIMYLI